MGRATQGVTLISVDDGSMLSGVRRVVESDADDDGEDIADVVDPAAPDGVAGPADGTDSAT
jgi:DNA gyrase subunit A